MKTKEVLLYTALNVTGNFDSGLQMTGDDANVHGGEAGIHVADTRCRFTIDVTGFAGTSMAVDIVAVVGGNDMVIGSFANVTGVTSETIALDDVPSEVKIVGTATAITDFDATVYSSRFV